MIASSVWLLHIVIFIFSTKKENVLDFFAFIFILDLLLLPLRQKPTSFFVQYSFACNFIQSSV